MGLRRTGREYALQFLFAIDFNKDKLTKNVVDEKLSSFWKNLNPYFNSQSREFAEKLIRNTLENKNKIDSHLKKVSENWKLDRMSAVDRNILRIGISEFLFFDDIDYDVTINESIEIAKKFGTEKSPSFINGVLDKVKKELSKKE
ncbi:MAG: transcription antitermination factor NusB [Candidatus Schekmanbacteria bacterium RIFCSPHIGHO2_02_FULL_38_11]|uniref:Transcription antitermination protein NusB n=1 Tax=Candidatus Schekmanbacteria bacterium RIFCSPLOWO2_12_FULL_38_15 TaxID=1817883 RepID=A0A1F7SG07_9BACT|nr:MAG: transcription antitermination factor NusB [Candidatus Schekmanbacteria bacterium GWA2_38_9]OGL49471.1 MAG: transcription antitermination factor NusB [Candidatus Schekmanbacteria bacterium RIFCSPLOWO2_02_FULL_38_14]OGL52164.1 MAG: transcription antitermination factor NusB [Candidatus Schekmanbacteria bacterium RIFCSPLOWO2_12_FULL_38_15]OGL53581.1 MAG: transcription antitermination factor NusB [Candidatus Schekmanbacteria bacterium RIFCSPHIGHO2_02_FULL_38_11]